jgi:diaminohydroxyphosphoribosylaminopyrimidine deaminase/5-amino-6-(5-phosphoribosylamino)uracil reductase
MGKRRDDEMMRRALALAVKGVGRTSPNPCVGAVIERGGQVLGEGWHQRAGGPHAEVVAVRAAKRAGHSLAGSTLYVTLEPCCTHGRTPPCTDLILREGFRRVVVGAVDPNPAHAGRAFPLLEKAGIEVVSGVLAEECRAINRAFNHWIVTKRPWVILKLAMTLDGCLALPPGEGQWITGLEARREVQTLRAAVDAVMVGAGTARADNPRLTVRGIRMRRQPWRVIVTKSGQLPRDLKIFTDAHRDRTKIVSGPSWDAIFKELGEIPVTSVLVEGGAKVANDLVKKGWVNEVVCYFAPIHAGAGGKARVRGLESLRLMKPELRAVGNDLCLRAEVKRRS